MSHVHAYSKIHAEVASFETSLTTRSAGLSEAHVLKSAQSALRLSVSDKAAPGWRGGAPRGGEMLTSKMSHQGK